MAAGPEAFARQVAATDRGRGGRRSGPDGRRGTAATATGSSAAGERREPPVGTAGVGVPVVAVEPADDRAAVPRAGRGGSRASRPDAPAAPAGGRSRASRTSRRSARRRVGRPRRTRESVPGIAARPSSRPSRSRRTATARSTGGRSGTTSRRSPTRRAAAHRGQSATTAPLAAPAGVLHVRFNAAAATDRVVGAMEEVRTLLRSRPGTTRVVLHVPQGGGRDALPMELRSGSPTTPSCWPRWVAGSGTASSTCASPDRSPGLATPGTPPAVPAPVGRVARPDRDERAPAGGGDLAVRLEGRLDDGPIVGRLDDVGGQVRPAGRSASAGAAGCAYSAVTQTGGRRRPGGP